MCTIFSVVWELLSFRLCQPHEELAVQEAVVVSSPQRSFFVRFSSQVKFELSIDASGVFPFLSSDDFENDSLLSLVDVTPSSLSIAANGHAPKLLSFPSTALNASSWDVDVTMIPIGSSKNRDYE